MNFSLVVLDLTERGVQCALNDSDAPFWIPRRHPAVVWSAPPEPGETVTVRLPAWLVQKHQQLTALRHQMGLAFHQPPGPDPIKATAEGSLPMSDYPQDIGEGALFKNREKSKPSQPDYFGKAEVQGVKLKVSAWLKESKKNPGQKFMSLSFRLDESQEQRSNQVPKSSGGQSFADADIPFATEWRG